MMEAQTESVDIFNIAFDDDSRETLKVAILWAKISAVCAVIGYVLALLAAFLGKSANTTTSFNESGTTVTTVTRGGTVAGALVVAIIGTAINYFLYKFAADAGKGLSQIEQLKLNEGLANLKTYFKILGIILIICIVLLGLVLLIALFSSMAKH